MLYSPLFLLGGKGMALNLKELFKWKSKVDILDENNNIAATVWVRVLGDWDIQQAYKLSRAASNLKRLALRDSSTLDYQDEVLPVQDFTREEKYEVIKSARQTSIIGEATVAIERPELPKIEEIAPEPDAAGLEDLEKLDKITDKIERDYQRDIENYVNERMAILNHELEDMSDEELSSLAMKEVSNVVPFSIFMEELGLQKIFRGTYLDEYCKERAFDSIEEVRDLHSLVKQQLLNAFSALELNPDEVKNS